MLRREPLVISQLIFTYIFYTAFLIIPISYVLLIALRADVGSLFINPKYFSLDVPQEPVAQYVRPDGRVIFIIRGFNYGIIPNSLLIATITTLLSLLIGVALALLISRYSFPLKGVLKLILYIPMIPAPFINAFVAFKLFDPVYGLIPWLMVDFLKLPWGFGFQEMAGVILAQTLAFYPIAFINISASMLSQDPSAEEQAENLGGRGFRLFRTVTLPLSTPGVAAAASTIFILSLEDLGGPIAFKFRNTMSYEIFSSFRSEAAAGSISPLTAFLGLLLLAISVSVFVIVREVTSRKQYVFMSKGGGGYSRFKNLGPKGLLALYLLAFPFAIFSSMPQIGVVIFALSGSAWLRSPVPQEISLGHVMEMFSDPVAIRALYNSLLYSLAALVIMILISISVAYPAQRFRSPYTLIIDSIAMSSLSIPGLVVALGYLYFFMDLSAALGFNYLDSVEIIALSIVIAYSVRKAPFIIRATYSGIQQIPVSLEEAASNLGSRRAGIIAGITLPLAKLSIAGGSLLSWVYAFSETSVSVTLGGLAGIGINHAAPMTFVMSDYILGKVQAIAVVASLGVILMIVEILAISIATYLTKQRLAVISIT